MADPILIAKNTNIESVLLPELANRHGCITGATGIGKTVTLQVLAQAFSRIGTPVFMADVKGDLSGFSLADRKSVVQGKSVSVSVDLCCSRIIHKDHILIISFNNITLTSKIKLPI